jgi:hypothetical protein
MTNAERDLVLAMLTRSVEAWIDGDEHRAARWFAGAAEVIGEGEFVDEGADR